MMLWHEFRVRLARSSISLMPAFSAMILAMALSAASWESDFVLCNLIIRLYESIFLGGDGGGSSASSPSSSSGNGMLVDLPGKSDGALWKFLVPNIVRARTGGSGVSLLSPPWCSAGSTSSAASSAPASSHSAGILAATRALVLGLGAIAAHRLPLPPSSACQPGILPTVPVGRQLHTACWLFLRYTPTQSVGALGRGPLARRAVSPALLRGTAMRATGQSSQERAVGTALQHMDKSAVPNYMKLRRLDHSGVCMQGGE